MTLNPKSCDPCSRLSGERRLTVKTIALLLAVLTFGLFPCVSAAQGILPVQWFQSSINYVTSIAYSPDGSIVVIAGGDGVQIFTIATGVTTFVPTNVVGGLTDIQSVSLSPDGKTFAVCGDIQTLVGYVKTPVGIVEIWNAATSSLVASYSLNNE